LHTVAGTPYFIAPEVLQGNYGKECDIWSLGILLYVLITGKYPFDGSGRSEVFAKIIKGDFTFPESTKKNVSADCLELIKRMLTVDRHKRISCD
jgi:calcium-dependent protein kinase